MLGASIFLDLMAIRIPKRPSAFLWVDNSQMILSYTSKTETNLSMQEYDPDVTSWSNFI